MDGRKARVPGKLERLSHHPTAQSLPRQAVVQNEPAQMPLTGGERRIAAIDGNRPSDALAAPAP